MSASDASISYSRTGVTNSPSLSPSAWTVVVLIWTRVSPSTSFSKLPAALSPASSVPSQSTTWSLASPQAAGCDVVQVEPPRQPDVAPKMALGTGRVHPVGHQLVHSLEDTGRILAPAERHQLAGVPRLCRRRLLDVLQVLHHGLDRGLVEIGQEQMHVVQRRIPLDAPRQRRAHHAPQELGDVGMVLRPAEGHHHLRPRAVPTGREAGLEQDHADALVLVDARGIDPPHPPPAEVHVPAVVHRMHRLPLQQAPADGLLDHVQRHPEIGPRHLPPGPVLHLDHQDGPDPPLVLGRAIGVPCLAHPHPGPRRLLQEGHLGVPRHLGMMDRDAVLQQARGAHVGHRHGHLVQGVGRVLQQIGEALRCRRHADHQRHPDQARLAMPQQEALDQGLGLLGKLAAGHAPVRLVDHQVEAVRDRLGGVRAGRPDRPGPPVPLPGQALVRPELLHVDEVDGARLKLLPVEARIDGHQPVHADPIRDLVDPAPGLLVELRHVRDPQDRRVGLGRKAHGAEQDVLEQGRHHHRLAAARRGRERDRLGALTGRILARHADLLAQLREGRLLEVEQLALHRAPPVAEVAPSPPIRSVLIRKFSR